MKMFAGEIKMVWNGEVLDGLPEIAILRSRIVINGIVRVEQYYLVSGLKFICESVNETTVSASFIQETTEEQYFRHAPKAHWKHPKLGDLVISA